MINNIPYRIFMIISPILSAYFFWCLYDISLPLDNFKLTTVYIIDKQTGARIQEYDLILQPKLQIQVKRSQELLSVRSGKFFRTADIRTNRFIIDSEGKEIFENNTIRYSIPEQPLNVAVLFDITSAMSSGPAVLKVSSIVRYHYNLISWLFPKYLYREDIRFNIID